MDTYNQEIKPEWGVQNLFPVTVTYFKDHCKNCLLIGFEPSKSIKLLPTSKETCSPGLLTGLENMQTTDMKKPPQVGSESSKSIRGAERTEIVI